MKAFNRIFAAVLAAIAALFAAANLICAGRTESGRPWRVEISRLVREMEEHGFAADSLADCEYVTGIEAYGESFFDAESDYVIREINGELYRFDYRAEGGDRGGGRLTLNLVLAAMAALVIAVMLYVKLKILRPFEQLSNIPYELSRGNLTAPVKEEKSRFFGRFVWGVDMLREHMEQQKKRELDLQREKKLLLLSLSHDIKTPLSAIKLYAKALSKGIYKSSEKQITVAENICAKVDEIEGYVSQIAAASREEFLSFDVRMEEFFLSGLVTVIREYYTEKLSLIRTDFSVSACSDCLLCGDLDRAVEVLQNVVENAIKYGDGRSIAIDFSEEDDCVLITVSNSGCTLAAADLPYLFDSFWRGTNAEKEAGNGLGLYICRQLMRKMNGEIFAETDGDYVRVTAVFAKA